MANVQNFTPSNPFIGKVILDGKTQTVVSFELENSDTSKVSNNDTIHNILLLDRSGSMSRDINNLIEDVKKVVRTVNQDDYLTIIWFSGENQFRTVVKCSKNSPDDVCKILDTLKSTVGCTCFSQPLEEMANIVEETTCISDVINVTVFTDGMPVTSWSSSEEESRIMNILNNLKATYKDKTIAINTIGYSDYYNRDLLVSMSETSEYGVMNHASKIEDYSTFVLRGREAIKDLVGKRVKIIADNAHILTQSAVSSKLYENIATMRLTKKSNVVNILYDKEVDTVSYIVDGIAYSANSKTKFSMTKVDDIMYHYAYQYFYHGLRNLGTDVLNFIGNKTLLNDAVSSFTASELGEFINTLRDCAFKTITRPKGKVTRNTYIVNDAVTVVDILDYLVKNDALYKPNKQYKRIGRATHDMNDRFSALNGESFHPMSDLVFNKDRLNVSIKFPIEGVVKIDPQEATRLLLTKEIPAHVFRTHTIINDGALNMKTLNVWIPDTCDKDCPVYEALQKFRIEEDKCLYKINLSKFRIVSKSSEMTIEELYDTEVKILNAEASNKVLNYLIKNCGEVPEVCPPSHPSMYRFDQYSPEQKDYLSSIGINSSFTYSPKNVKVSDATDYYEVREVRTSMSGFATLPSVADVLKKVSNNKSLTPREALIYSKYSTYSIYDKNIETLEKIRKSNKTFLNTSRLKVSSAKLIRTMTGNPWFTSTETDKFLYPENGSEYTLVVNYVKTTVGI